MLLRALAACTTLPLTPGATPPAEPTAPDPFADGAPRSAGELRRWPAVVLNEVLPGNDGHLSDERAEYDDWLELYFPGPGTADLSGWSVRTDPESPPFVFDAGTTLGAGEHLIVWADGQRRQGPLHAPFALSEDGEALELVAPDGTVVDRLTWPALPDDVVYGRFPSGGTNRAASIRATPWNTNPVDPGLSLDPSDAMFPELGVIRLDLWVSEVAADRLRDHDRATVKAGLAFEDAWLYPIGLSIKGGLGSRRSFDDKAAFRLNLDAFVDGFRLRGLETLTLNNMVQDPSTVHETLAYALLRDAGAPAPRTAHVELWMNGEYRGLYLHVETVDDQFLERWYADPEGNVYEGTYGEDLIPQDVEDLDLDEVGAAEPGDRSELQELADFLAQPPTEALMPEFEALVDLDRTLPAMAGEVVLGHWDGYYWSANNYRVYHEPSVDQWSLIVSGTDQTFEDERRPYEPVGVLGSFCLGIPSCARRFDLALWEMSDRLAALECQGRVAELLPRTVPLYEADTYKENSRADLEDEVDDTLTWCDERAPEVQSWIFP